MRDASPVTIVFVAGGSIGHIAPCLAVWEVLKRIEPDARTLFLCSNRLEDTRFLEKEGVEFVALGSRRVSFFNIVPRVVRAWTLLRKWLPDVIFSKGGGVTIPVALAAWMLQIPLVVHESDAVSGRATRFLSRFAKKVIRGFPNNPVRSSMSHGSRNEGLRITGLSGNRPILLVLGGSQGAMALNDAVAHHLDELLSFVDIIHLTGEGKGLPRRSVRRGSATPRREAKPGYWETPFAHEELPHLYAAADFALSRAGAGSISELAANGIRGILVPLEGLAHDHQVMNAEASSGRGFEVLRQADLARELPIFVKKYALSSSTHKKGKEYRGESPAASLAKILLAATEDHGRVS